MTFRVSLFNDITSISDSHFILHIPIAILEWVLSEFLLYFPASFILKITFSEWQPNQFNNMQFYTVGTYSRVPPHTCNCWVLFWTALCVSELFSSPGSWGGLALWDGQFWLETETFSSSPFHHTTLLFVTQSCEPVPSLPSTQLC